MNAAVSGTRGVPDTESNWDYEVKGTSIKADLLSIPKEGGTFEVAKYLDPQLAADLEAGTAALSDPLVAAAAASQIRSCHIAGVVSRRRRCLSELQGRGGSCSHGEGCRLFSDASCG